jgi:hypothetical protein
MWHSRFFGALLAVLAFWGFTESQAALAAYPTSSEFSMSQPQGTHGPEGSFQLAIMGGSTSPLDMPPEKSTPTVQPVKPAIEKPKATPKKASKPKKKKVRKANVKKAPAKKPEKEEEGFLTKTFNQLIGNDDVKKDGASKSKIQKTAGKAPEKKEDGFLTKTLKSLVGSEEKEEKTAEKNSLNPIDTTPADTKTKKIVQEQPKTAKAETKQTLKDSFEKLIGVGAVKDKGDSKSAKTDSPAGETKSAKKKESGGLLDGILGSNDDKKVATAKKSAKVENTVKEPAPVEPKKLAARKYPVDPDVADDRDLVEKNYGGAKKGKNLLKESFKTLVKDEKKAEEE